MLTITYTGGGRFALDFAKFRGALADEEPHVPTAARQEERPAFGVYELVELARASGALTCPQGVELELISIDEIEDSGLIVAVRGACSAARRERTDAVTAGYLPSEEFLISDVSQAVRATEATRASEAVRNVLREANAILERADVSELASEVGYALRGDCTGAEHDALVSVAGALGIERPAAVSSRTPR